MLFGILVVEIVLILSSTSGSSGVNCFSNESARSLALAAAEYVNPFEPMRGWIAGVL